ncbi:SAM-dependent methyltransferase [Planktosalinus lacus]|uniref:SAM-dependent methyltransferase n=1 Tax=Planktosalinus lacus TaxID=1526573 RepID=A0A8J2YAF4_9FLAO|nr:SAM-dependent methyltransferase [Planktosalinus lacus]GGD91301.1 SAM-dependent methyltransferase [Planktosalinus lacus]
MELNKDFWEERYQAQKTGWDIGAVSEPLKVYIDSLKDTSATILIPGAGNSYEAEYLHNKGFENVDVIDIAKQPLVNFQNRVPDFPKENLIQTDFFEFSKTYDLILEQTFFCALDPVLRQEYANKMSTLLNKNGKLAGVLFDFPLTKDGPPFGGSKSEYITYFQNLFNIKTMERCYNSILPRKDTELFIIFEKE